MQTIRRFSPLSLLSWGGRKPSANLTSIPFDIFIEFIFQHLNIQDIIRLRRVSKWFFHLTHEPSIWRRFLPELNLLVPPIRPSVRYLSLAGRHEAEHAVTRAVSLADNWTRPAPRVYAHTTVDTAHYVPSETALLPGGKFMLAAMNDASRRRANISIFGMDHPRNGHVMLGRIDLGIQADAYGLVARYAPWKGKMGIVLAYQQRTLLRTVSGDAKLKENFMKATDYVPGRDIDDPAAPFLYHLTCVFIDVDALEELVDPWIIPGSMQYVETAERHEPSKACTRICHRWSKYKFVQPNLFQEGGQPFLGWAYNPDRVHCLSLDDLRGMRFTLESDPDVQPERYQILTWRCFGAQSLFLTVRSLKVGEEWVRDETRTTSYNPLDLLQKREKHDVVAEIFYPTSVGGDGETFCAENFKISEAVDDVPLRAWVSESEYAATPADWPRLQQDDAPPRPVGLFLQFLQAQEDGTMRPALRHEAIFPSVLNREALINDGMDPADAARLPEWTWSFDNMQLQSLHVADDEKAGLRHVVPGAYRPLAYEVARDDRKAAPAVHAIVRGSAEALQYPIGYDGVHVKTWWDDKLLDQRDANAVAADPNAHLQRIPPSVAEDMAQGVAGMAWDECMGRLCIIAPGKSVINVLDLSSAAQPDSRFGKWERSSGFLC
ncbi:hypothetical protein BD626DRAFT_405584 [Schizophyllum amplum]|uniref:F-box domain-containing protein n=1 Tax=Schizophyllum amplum TaxID=97359 RepID=A0A550CAB8_9AGAR|nr:hypothetical protein BD626DRAFT_405584 [Auriculariopsis ampla]